MFRRFLLSRASRQAVTIAAAAAAVPFGLVACAEALIDAAPGGTPAAKLQLMPIGTITPRGNGSDTRGPWIVRDQAHCETILAATRAYYGAIDPSVDYDHMALKVRTGEAVMAPAAAWLSNLRVEATGIWADVQWTGAAAARLADREYRYVSPVFTHARDGTVIALQGLSLVNTPAIDTLAAAAASMEPHMDKIAQALGLSAGASEADILAAITALKADEATEAAAARLGLGKGATVDEIVAAATAAASAGAKPDPAAFVPIAAFAELTAKVTALTAGTKAKDADAFVAAASVEGKLTPAGVDWMRDLFISDEAKARAWLATAPVVIAAGAVVGGKIADPSATATAEELRVAALVGVSADAFTAEKKKGN